jgi:UDP-N-acetylglucosamine 4-epimerase
MAELLRKFLSEYDEKIKDIEIQYGPVRVGDVPHSKASIEKAEKLLNYQPTHRFADGLKDAVEWYWGNL